MFRRRAPRVRPRRLRRLLLAGVAVGGVAAYRNRRIAAAERQLWPATEPSS